MLNSLSFCLSLKLLISPSYLNEILAGYSNLGCRLFYFFTLSVSCHSLLAWRVSMERSAVILMEFLLQFSSVQFSHSVMSNSLRSHEPCSTPGLSVHHQLPGFTQTHVHWVGDAMQPSHPLLSPSSPDIKERLKTFIYRDKKKCLRPHTGGPCTCDKVPPSLQFSPVSCSVDKEQAKHRTQSVTSF